MSLGHKVRETLVSFVQSQAATKDWLNVGPSSDRHQAFQPLARLRRLRPARQFLLLATFLLAFFISIGGLLQSQLVTAKLIEGSTRVASIYMSGIIAPHVQSLKTLDRLREDEQSRLEFLISETGLRNQIQQLRIWLPNGIIAYASDPELVGQQIRSKSVERAAGGQLVYNIGDDTEHSIGDEHVDEMMEIYIPIRDASGAVIAVGEFYQSLDALHSSLSTVIIGSWAIRICLAIAAIVPLYVVVLRADRHLAAQRRAAHLHYRRNMNLSQQNLALRKEAEDARRRAAQANEELLSRVGADLHDGPVQLLTLAALQADTQSKSIQLVQEAVAELRFIASGLVLPELSEVTAVDALKLAVARHERNTGTHVETDIADLPETISHELRACMYRVVQEALHNAARHAGGRGQRVEARSVQGMIIVRVSDTGTGIGMHAENGRGPHLGLIAARNRVSAFKGKFTVRQVPGIGTEIVAHFPADLDKVSSRRASQRRPESP